MPSTSLVVQLAAGAPDVRGSPPAESDGDGDGDGVNRSSLTIVTWARARPSVALCGLESSIENVSSASRTVSPSTSTLRNAVVCPGANVSWPLAAR